MDKSETALKDTFELSAGIQGSDPAVARLQGGHIQLNRKALVILAVHPKISLSQADAKVANACGMLPRSRCRRQIALPQRLRHVCRCLSAIAPDCGLRVLTINARCR